MLNNVSASTQLKFSAETENACLFILSLTSFMTRLSELDRLSLQTSNVYHLYRFREKEKDYGREDC